MNMNQCLCIRYLILCVFNVYAYTFSIVSMPIEYDIYRLQVRFFAVQIQLNIYFRGLLMSKLN